MSSASLPGDDPAAIGHGAQATAEFDPTAALPDRPLLLEASAGTGKTHQLTSLVLRLVAEHDMALPRLLVVTFTRAAAAELRERIRTRLGAAARALHAAEHGDHDPASSDDPIVAHLWRTAGGADGTVADRAERLRRAGEQLDEATISTIHGFCQRMLTVAALPAGSDLDAELVDDQSGLVDDVVADLIDQRLRGLDDDTYAHLSDWAGLHTETIRAAVREATGGAPRQLLPRPDPAPAADAHAHWARAVERFRRVWQAQPDDLAEELWAALRAAEDAKVWKSKSAGHEVVGTVTEWLAEDARLPTDLDAWRQNQGPGPGALMTRFRERPQSGVHPVLDAAIELEEAAHAIGDGLLADMAKDADRRLTARKRREGLLDYDDLLRHLADALDDEDRREQVRRAIRGRYDAALIDEFQDTDPQQWRIFKEVFGDPNGGQRLLLVGDPKQAIYAFRGADLPTYLKARDDEELAPVTRALDESWRSDGRYLAATNALFGDADAFGDDRITPPKVRPAAHLAADRLAWPDGAPRPGVTLRFVHTAAADAEEGLHQEAITKGWAQRALPLDVAAQARELLHGADGPPTRVERRPDGSERRHPLAAGDLAVLVRTNRQARAVQQRLLEADVPATLGRGTSVFTTPECDEVLRLLEALASPPRERLARAAAATRLFAWTAAEVLDPAHEVAWERWRDQVAAWSRRWHQEGVLPTLRAVIGESGAAERLLPAPGGDRMVTNLWHLAERLHAVERTERLGPAALVTWLRGAREEALEGVEASEDTELRLERDDAAVQVVTVHASKGLQYPVVLCPFLWDVPGGGQPGHVLRFNDEQRDEKRSLDLRAHKSKRPDPQAADGTAIDPVAMATRQRHAEQLRLAYVALTRAQHHAIVWWGLFNGAERSPLAWLLHRSRGDDHASASSSPSDGGVALGKDDQQLRGELEDLVTETNAQHADTHAGGVLALSDLDAPPLAPAVPDGDAEPVDAPPLAEAVFAGRIDRAWRRTSFTGLTRSAVTPEDDEPASAEGRRDDDEDDQADTQQPGTVQPLAQQADADQASADADTAQVALPLADLPRGPAFGTLVHAVLEDVDFTAADDDPAGLGPVVADHVARSPALEEPRAGELREGLRAVLATPLGADLGEATLASVARGDRSDELAFELPVAGGSTAHVDAAAVAVERIAAILADHDEPAAAAAIGQMSGPSFRGFLTGSVDLLARVRRDDDPGGAGYLVVDYKTTWLGRLPDPNEPRDGPRSTLAHYAPQALATNVHQGRYHLQALLYLVAVHRYLTSRLGGAYDPDRDLLGVAYLYVRGMVGPASRRSDGASHGVWRWRPSTSCIEAVSALLHTGDPASRSPA